MCEGFHNRFNRFLRKRKPNIWVFLKKILQENTNIEIKIHKIELGNYQNKSKKSRMINFNNSMQEKLKELEKCHITLEEFLLSIDLLSK